ncbi:MAG: outer membrane protein assembly factor BamA [Pseudomonadota bacterium]
MSVHRMTMAARLMAFALAVFAIGHAPQAQAQLAQQQTAGGQIVSEVVVIGNQRIEAATVASYLALGPGDAITEAALNRSVRQLFDTGLFKDAAIAPDGSRLLVQVVENPSINRINFEGNDLISDEQMLALVTSRPRRPFTRSQAEADAEVLIENYRRTGRYGAVVEPVIIELPDNRVDLVFEIVEGSVTEIREINFVGNEVFSDRTLRGEIDTTESGILGFLLSSDIYDPDRLEFDKQLLRRFYLSEGYADFAVLSAVAELAPDRQGFFITFTVEEGQRYDFGELDVRVSAPGLDEEEFRALIPPLEGEIYDASEVEDVIEDLVFRAGQEGFAFVDVRPLAQRNEVEQTINIIFELIEGQRVYVERIDIEGNDRTLDRVIRRQFDIAEGDAFNAREIEKARNRIRALGYFATIDVRTELGDSDDRARVKVEVTEQSTGSINFGVGFSSATGPTGEISIQEANFLGRGQFVRARLRVSDDTQVVDLTFREPAFLDRDLTLGLNAFFRNEDLDTNNTFELTSIGFIPSLTFPVSDVGRLQVSYEISDTDIRDIENNSSPFIFDDEGRQTTSAIGLGYVHDLRNDPIEPTAGYFLTLNQTFAGLGGGAVYSETRASAKTWTSFFDDDVVASLEVEGGVIFPLNNDVRIDDRFFLGGDSFRGFAFAGLGPRDQSVVPDTGVQRDDALGGNMFAVARAEVSFPLGLPEEFGIFGGAFVDVGTLWGLDNTVTGDRNADGTAAGGNVFLDDSAQLRASAGFILFIDSAFGPLQLTFARPIVEEDGDEREFFRLSVGTRF